MPSVRAARIRTTIPPGLGLRRSLVAQFDLLWRNEHRYTHASIADRMGSGSGRLDLVARVDGGNDQREGRARLSRSLVEENGLPADARGADALDVRAHPQPIAHKCGRVILGLDANARQPEAVLGENAFVGKAEFGKKLHLSVLGKSRIGSEIHDARHVHVGPLHLQACLERARAGRQRIAKASQSLLLPC